MASCVNVKEVMLSILKSMHADSRERKSASAQIYRRAYRSLQACPLPLQHPTEAVQLDGFGYTLTSELERRLECHCTENGLVMPERSECGPGGSVKACCSCRCSVLPTALAEVASSSRGVTASSSAASSSRSSSEDESAIRSKRKKPTRTLERKGTPVSAVPKTKSKQYVPQHRSGSHGILVALYSLTEQTPISEMDVDATGHSKATIMKLAQPFSDSKYAPKPMPPGMNRGPSFAYSSAWSSMKTLVNRGYVYRRGNPARFALSQEGWDVARQCAEKDSVLAGSKIGEEARAQSASDVDVEEEGHSHGTKERRKGKKKATSDLVCPNPCGEEGTSKQRQADQSSVVSGPFRYVYLREGEPSAQTMERSKASIRLSDQDYTMTYRIAFEEKLKDHPFVQACVDKVVNLDAPYSGDLLAGYLRASSSNERAPGLCCHSRDKALAADPSTRASHPGQDPDPAASQIAIAPAARESIHTNTTVESNTSSRTQPKKKTDARKTTKKQVLAEKGNVSVVRDSDQSTKPNKSNERGRDAKIDEGEIIEIVTSSDIDQDAPTKADYLSSTRGKIVDLGSSDDSSDSSLGNIYDYLSSSQRRNTAKTIRA